MKKVLFLFLAVVALSCSEDDPDIRDQAVGTYNYTLKFYYLDGSTLEYLGSDFDDSGTMIVEKSSTSSLIFKEGGTEQLRAEKIAAASNGFSFDVPSQTYEDDDISVTISGYNGIELDGTKYHGGYFSATKKIEVYFQFKDNNNETFVIELILSVVK
ncbi:MAG: hypothetical protein WAU36_06605 [Cyclobacteriaceae bacterium]